jgi:hypothetical protein
VAAAIRSKWPVEGARWILLQPGARWVNKRWPVEYFAALVRAGRGFDSTFRFAILGGNEDREFGAIISRADPTRCLDLTGRLSLPEMVEWIRAGELLVTDRSLRSDRARSARRPALRPLYEQPLPPSQAFGMFNPDPAGAGLAGSPAAVGGAIPPRSLREYIKRASPS